MVFVAEVLKANGASGLAFVCHSIEVFASQSLGDLLNLVVELSLAGLEQIVLVDGVGNDEYVRERIPNLNVANVQVGQHKVREDARVLVAHTVVLAGEVHQVSVDEPPKENTKDQAACEDAVNEPASFAILHDSKHQKLLQIRQRNYANQSFQPESQRDAAFF